MFLATILGQIYANVVPFVILLGILIFVHELGHFLVARFCGVRVEIFSLGFGKKIFSYKRGDTTYCISLIPLGGYVKMFGEQPLKMADDETSVPFTEEEKKVSFTHKTVWQRIAIVLAGPLMNFFFAAFLFTLIVELGEETRSAVVAEVEVGSIAASAGLQSGDRILQINQIAIQSYEDFQKTLNQFKGQKISMLIASANKEQKTLTLEVGSMKNPNIFSSETVVGTIEGVQSLARGSVVGVLYGSPAFKAGFKTGDEIVSVDSKKIARWSDLEIFFGSVNSLSTDMIDFEVERNSENETARSKSKISLKLADLKKFKSISDFGLEYSELYLDQVVKGSPAEMADLKKNDKLIAINSKKLNKWEEVLNSIKSFDGKEALNITLIRDGTELTKKITPLVTSQMTAMGQEDKRYTIGIVPMVAFAQPEMTKVQSKSVFASIQKGFGRTIDISSMTVFSFIKLFQGEVSHKNIGGMISIGKAAKDSFEMGLQSFLMTMGILSVSLFILNLLPIPVLDGGHLVFYFVEAIKGSPLSVKKMEIAQQIGFVLLMGLMVLALFNDFTKFFFKT